MKSTNNDENNNIIIIEAKIILPNWQILSANVYVECGCGSLICLKMWPKINYDYNGFLL